MPRTILQLPRMAPESLSLLKNAALLPPRLRYTLFNKEKLEEREVANVADIPAASPEGAVLWIELDGISNIELLQALADRFGIHSLAIEDVLTLGQRPKLEPYENHLFIVSHIISVEENGILTGEQVSLFMGRGYLLSIQETPRAETFQPVRERLKTARGLIRKMGADYLTYTLLDTVVDHKFPLLEQLGEALDDLDDEVVSKPSIEHVHQLHSCKRLLAQMRRFVWPEREIINALLHDDSGLVHRETKIYLRDCYDHTVQIMDLIESYRDVSTANMDMYLSSVGMRTNEIMRVLTVISSIFIPLTFLAGIWGMNFQGEANGQAFPLNMPELHHPLGYPICLCLMLSVAVVQIIYFRKKKWL